MEHFMIGDLAFYRCSYSQASQHWGINLLTLSKAGTGGFTVKFITPVLGWEKGGLLHDLMSHVPWGYLRYKSLLEAVISLWSETRPTVEVVIKGD